MKITYRLSPVDADQVRVYDVQPGQLFDEWLHSSGVYSELLLRPTVVSRNGIALLSVDYRFLIDPDDVIVLEAIPRGPAMLAIGAFIASNWVVIAATALSFAAASLMTPGMPDYAQPGAAVPSASPTYNIESRGNRARLGQPKSVGYGSPRVWPDLGSAPYTEYVNNDQYLYQIFEIKQGQADIDINSMRFHNTPLTAFGEYDVEVLQPGEFSALYPSEVVVAQEVSGQSLIDVTLGPFPANAPGTVATRIGFDITAGGGLFEQTDTGDLRTHSVGMQFEAQALDANDVPQGNWFVLGNKVISGDHPTAVRRSFFFSVDPGRYQVKVIRTTPKSSSGRIRDDIEWASLRGYLRDQSIVSNMTRVAIRIRATNAIAQKVATKFNCIAQCKTPVWDPVSGWSAPVYTANPAWAFADAVRASYGGSLSDESILLPELYALSQQFTAEGLEFNGVFDTKITLWDALKAIAQSVMGVPIDQNGVYRLVRDVRPAGPVAVFGMRNIKRGSFKVDHVGVVEETADMVIGEYFDASANDRQLTVESKLPGSNGNKPKRVPLFGVNNATQAQQIATYLDASNRYRRRMVSFETGREGLIPFWGNQIVVSHYMLGREQGLKHLAGDIVAFDGVDTIQVTESLAGLSDPFVVLRDSRGQPTGALRVSVQSSDGCSLKILDVFDVNIIALDAHRERIQFAAGEGSEFCELVKVTKVSPSGKSAIRVEGFIDNPAVYDLLQGVSAPPPDVQVEHTTPPDITGLSAAVTGTLANPVVTLSWELLNADRAALEYSTDAGASWVAANSGYSTGTTVTLRPLPGIIRYRVAGVSLSRGPWREVSVDTSTVLSSAPTAPTGLQSVGAFVGTTLSVSWASGTDNHLIQCYKSGVLKHSREVTGKEWSLLGDAAQAYGLGRAFELRVYSINIYGKRSDDYASLAVSNPAPAAPLGIAATGVVDGVFISANMSAEPDIKLLRVYGSNISGFAPSAANILNEQAASSVQVMTEASLYVRLAWIDVWGDEGLNYSPEFQVSPGVVDGSKISVAALSAIAADIGEVTAGVLRSADGDFIIDLTNKYIYIR